MLTFHLSVSLDGFVAGPDISTEQAMGVGGDALHSWLGGRDPIDQQVAGAMFHADTVGAVLLGRRTFDVGVGHWGDDGAFRLPCFVVTHRAHEVVTKGPTTFDFFTDGLDRALNAALEAAGDRDVNVMGADLARQLMMSGRIDELNLTLVPVILGGGATLFGNLLPDSLRLEQLEVRPSSTVTHIRYRVRP